MKLQENPRDLLGMIQQWGQSVIHPVFQFVGDSEHGKFVLEYCPNDLVHNVLSIPILD